MGMKGTKVGCPVAVATGEGPRPGRMEYILLVVHCVLVQTHAAMLAASPVLMGPGTRGTTGPEQDTQEGSSEQPQGCHGDRYLGGGKHRR